MLRARLNSFFGNCVRLIIDHVIDLLYY